MNRFVLVILTFSFFSCSHQNEEVQYDINSRILAFNGLAESFSIIDPETLSINNDVKLTGKAPNQMVFDSGFLYLINSLDNNIVKYDAKSFSKVSEIYLGGGQNPYMMDIDDKYIYVSCWLNNSVAVIDRESEVVISEISVGERPQGVLCVGNKLYVTNTAYNSKSFDIGSFSVINTDRLELINTIDLEYKNPQTLFYNNFKDEIHIVCSGDNSIASDGGIVIVKDVSIVDSFKIGGAPVYGDGAKDGDRVYLSGIGTIRSYNLKTYEIYESINLGVDEFIPSIIAVDNNIFVSIFRTGKIKVYEKTSFKHITDLQGSDGVQQLLYIQ